MPERILLGTIADRINKDPNLSWDQQLDDHLRVSIPVSLQEKGLQRKTAMAARTRNVPKTVAA